jgi:hypothetical protein
MTGPRIFDECHIIKGSGPEKKNPKQQEVEADNPLSATLSLWPEWAFVVQFRESAHSSSLPSAYRVEHIMSGKGMPSEHIGDLKKQLPHKGQASHDCP